MPIPCFAVRYPNRPGIVTTGKPAGKNLPGQGDRRPSLYRSQLSRMTREEAKEICLPHLCFRKFARLADIYDSFGPFGAKSTSAAPMNPIAPAIANAQSDATAIRFCDLPFRPDRIYRCICDL